MNRILIIEDDVELNTMLVNLLSKDYEIVSAYSGTEALLHTFESFDLILLDYMLPGMRGDAVLKEIRRISEVPVIMITSVSQTDTVVQMLSQGANDYITKPFDIKILKARIAVQMRQNKNAVLNKTFKHLTYDTEELHYEILGKELILSNKEISFLNLLLENPNQTFTKENIYERVWGEDYLFDGNSINVLISGLRKKFRTFDPNNEYIQTIWGVGVRLAREQS